VVAIGRGEGRRSAGGGGGEGVRARFGVERVQGRARVEMVLLGLLDRAVRGLVELVRLAAASVRIVRNCGAASVYTYMSLYTFASNSSSSGSQGLRLDSIGRNKGTWVCMLLELMVLLESTRWLREGMFSGLSLRS
jgi:hypothetical protein